MIGKSMYVYDTPDATNEWTDRAKLHIAGLQEKLDNCNHDKERARRMEHLECPSCWYLMGGLSGQAFTRYTCQVCGEDFAHPNTSVPRVCRGCAARLHICVECGADIDLKRRRAAKPVGGEGAK
jgi:DNA-directed RNA polymerase subunit RPC12/RpoP